VEARSIDIVPKDKCIEFLLEPTDRTEHPLEIKEGDEQKARPVSANRTISPLTHGKMIRTDGTETGS